VEEEKGITWGCAFKISGDLALKYLEQRECTLGGYETVYSKFYPHKASEFSGITGEAFPVIIYIATPQNEYWLGGDDNATIASQIVKASGPSGHNIEYLLRLAQFMRDELPHAVDEHLFEIEKLVRDEIISQKICIYSVMGQNPQAIARDYHEAHRRQVSFAYTSRVDKPKLRCLNI
jgi:cation transport protein ChaC